MQKISSHYARGGRCGCCRCSLSRCLYVNYLQLSPSALLSLSFPFLIDDTNSRRNTCDTGKMQEIGNLDGCLRRQSNLAKDAHKRLKIISDEVGTVFVFVDLGNNCNQRADVSPFCPLQTGVETASSASSREISLTSKARLEEKRASILAAAEERKELGDRVFEVASRFAQLDKANCRFENAPSCAVAALSAHAFPETSCTRFAHLSSSPTPTPLFNIHAL
jgi:hypothetical protein